MLSEVSMLKEKQEETDAKIESMKQENEALWQEVNLCSIDIYLDEFD